MNRQLGERLASGVAAEVYRWGEDEVIKLYRAGQPAEIAVQEAEKTRMVAAAGIAVAKPRDTVALGDRYGVVFRAVRGISLLTALLREPAAAERLAAMFADVQRGLHRALVPPLPDLVEWLERRIDAADGLPGDLARAARERLATLPRDQRLCHGDFQPMNLMLGETGVVVIDWFDATRGHPCADLARTRLLLLHAGIPGNPPLAEGFDLDGLRRRFCAAWEARYQQQGGWQCCAPEDWMLPVAAARLAEPVPDVERERLLALIEGLVAG